MDFDSFHKQPPDMRVAALIHFKSDDVQRIQDWLDRAAKAGIIEPARVEHYDARFGTPCFYIP